MQNMITAKQAGTLYGLFRTRLEKSPKQKAFYSYCTQKKQWISHTWETIAGQVARWQVALLREGLKPGDRVALNLKNSVDWVVFDQAALGLGLVTVPLYSDDRPDNVAYMLEDADVKCLFLQNSHQLKRLLPSLPKEHHLQRIIINTHSEDTLPSPALYVKDWLPETKQRLNDWSTSPDQLASIIYTSGTTGKPKGVMLSHFNMLSIAEASLKRISAVSDDIFLSFLPLSHTLERTAGYYLPVMTGAVIAYSRGINQLAQDLYDIKPSILISVPRVFEKLYQKLNTTLAEQSVIKHKLFLATANIGWTKFKHEQHNEHWSPSFLLYPLLHHYIAKKVHAKMGGRLRLIVSGGAALPHYVAELFIGLGYNLCQGYGLTETSPVISVNHIEHNYPYSVGQPLDGIATKLGENNELLVKSPGNMLGYWNNHTATSQCIDSDGWLHTGDQARISDTGHIFITGRIKDILVLSNGEKIPPTDMEITLLQEPLFEQVMIIGEGRAFLTALIVLNESLWREVATELSLNADDKQSLFMAKTQQFIIQKIRDLLHAFPVYAKIRKVHLTLQPWTIEHDLLTTTLKLKRPQIEKKYKDEIASFY
ncbi:MAG TPA: long-chain fatty acid--CoA ligase [Methylophaga aminisulfidivorans]|uniref:Long-chain fatty acid--CoA ligase n=2 Tax=root TaxID=1 RepID=A0A7C1VQW3_9GAMM|nr:long-chain fatty acid--CoA ligase [Methylophaga aminisulfidivorans]